MTPEELKKSILQLAIQGKLVEQRPEEGTADDLYAQIQAEKQRLIKEGKIKKEKPLPEIIDDEIPFDIPESWKWVRIQTIGLYFADGPFGSNLKTAHYTSNPEVRIIQLSNIGEDGWKDKNVKYTTVQHLENVIPRCEVFPGDFVIAKMMPAGRTIIVPDLGTRITLGSDAMRLVPSNMICKEFLLYAMNSNVFIDQVYAEAHGITRVRTTLTGVKSYILPLPPLEEQNRIVAKIEELLPLVDKYADAYNRLEELNKTFPSDLKKSILQYAIQGKLVAQRPEEGTADDLYAQIQAEKQRLIKEGKIKKEKPLPEITDDEIPFDIPDSWKWVRFSNVISLLSGADLSPSKYNSESKGIPYLTGASNIENKNVIINRWTEYPNNIAVKGNILLTCKGTVGKTAILCEDKVHIARQIMAITSIGIDSEYAEFFVQSQIDYLKSLAKSMIPGIERSNVLNLSFPLPPLQEQKRIVEQIKKVYQVLDL